MDEAPKISLRHALDLLKAGPEMARKMGHTERLQERIPEIESLLNALAARLDALGSEGFRVLSADPRLAVALGRRHEDKPLETKRRLGRQWLVWFDLSATLAELESLAAQLTDLGCDGFAVLRSDAQLAAALGYHEDWVTRRLDAEQEDGGGVLAFGVYASPMLDHSKAIEKIMRNMLKLGQPIRLDLRQGQLTASCAALSFAIPATYESEGSRIVSGGFFSLLLDALRHDELLRCEITPELYRINGKAFRLRPGPGER